MPVTQGFTTELPEHHELSETMVETGYVDAAEVAAMPALGRLAAYLHTTVHANVGACDRELQRPPVRSSSARLPIR